jgi:hypothetical protein
MIEAPWQSLGVAVTTTPRFALPQWGAGSDSPSRTSFNSAFLAIDQRAALDLGEVGGTTLPVTDVLAGRTAQTIDGTGTYRKVYRRDVVGWKQTGGNTWDQTFYNRADGALATSAPARIVSHPSLANPGLTENWDGSSVAGGRQAIGDVNAAQPGALHVGDIASAVDLTTRGRIYARTTVDGQRGIVASAHGTGAGNLFTAIEPGGSTPWLVDAQGRMRAQAPSAFGAAALAANVPLVSSPGASDLTAADLYAAAGKPALRLFRAVGDVIGSFLPDAIALGKSSWTGGVIGLTAPTITLTGAAGVSGSLAVTGTLSATGATTLAAVSAAATTVTTLTASSTATFNGDVNLTGRLDLPTSLPTGTSAGQVRVSDDWQMEVYDGTKWRGRFGNRTGMRHHWGVALTSMAANAETRITSMTAKSGNGTLATVSNGYLTLNRAGLWTIDWDVAGDYGNSDMRVSAYMSWPSGGFWLNTDNIDITDSTFSSTGFASSGIFRCRASWTGYVPQSMVGTQIGLYTHQNNLNNAPVNAACSLRAEFLSD